MNNKEFYNGYIQALSDVVTYLNFINLSAENIGHAILEDVEDMFKQSKMVFDAILSKELGDSLKKKQSIITRSEFDKFLSETPTPILEMIKPK